MNSIINKINNMSLRYEKKYVKDYIYVEYWYDQNDNCVHTKYSDGPEIWYDYDENNNVLQSIHSDGFGFIHRYDSDGEYIECVMVPTYCIR